MPQGERRGSRSALSPRGLGHAHYSTFSSTTDLVDAQASSDEDFHHFADDEDDGLLPLPGRVGSSLPRYRDLEPGPPAYERRPAGWFRRCFFAVQTRDPDSSLQSANSEQGVHNSNEGTDTMSDPECPECQLEIASRYFGRCSCYCASLAGSSRHREYHARRARRSGRGGMTGSDMECMMGLSMFLVICLIILVMQESLLVMSSLEMRWYKEKELGPLVGRLTPEPDQASVCADRNGSKEVFYSSPLHNHNTIAIPAALIFHAMDALHKIAGVSEAQRSDAASPPPAPAPVTASTPAASTTVPLPNDTSDARSERRASLPLNRRPSHKSFRSGKSGKSGHSRASKSRNASRTSLALRDAGDVPPTPKLNKHPERNLYGDLAAQPVQPRSSAPSVHSSRHARQTTGGTLGGDDGESMMAGEEDSDFEWGPQHPCFPHPNPHCAPKCREAEETRVIRVKRDYLIAGDLYPQYANLYPEILDPLVSDEEFRDLIQQVNSILLRAFSPYTFRAWADAILGAATGYFWEDLGFTCVKSGEQELERYVERWNMEREQEGREVKLIAPRTTGFMSLDFVVPDPGIDIAAESEEDGDLIASDEQSQAGLGAALQQA